MAPKTIEELVEFYYSTVKPLYSSVQLTNVLPSEALFEINAAFDHLTRKWAYDEAEDVVVEKACSHLKRSCLDIFKISVRQAIDQFDELKKIDTCVIDNGQFDRKLIDLVSEIKNEAAEARKHEGNAKRDDAHAIMAFDLWFPVYAKCVRLEKEFYRHPAIDWAARRDRINKWKERGIGFIIGIIGGIITAYICLYMPGISQSADDSSATQMSSPSTRK